MVHRIENLIDSRAFHHAVIKPGSGGGLTTDISWISNDPGIGPDARRAAENEARRMGGKRTFIKQHTLYYDTGKKATYSHGSTPLAGIPADKRRHLSEQETGE